VHSLHNLSIVSKGHHSKFAMSQAHWCSDYSFVFIVVRILAQCKFCQVFSYYFGEKFLIYPPQKWTHFYGPANFTTWPHNIYRYDTRGTAVTGCRIFSHKIQLGFLLW